MAIQNVVDGSRRLFDFLIGHDDDGLHVEVGTLAVVVAKLIVGGCSLI